VNELSFSPCGDLLCRCTVHDEVARRANAFSVAATVGAWTVRDADRPGYVVEIGQATIDEISFTDFPACPACIVQFRERASPHVELCDILIAHLDSLSRFAERERCGLET
jgi:hypothetical protein